MNKGLLACFANFSEKFNSATVACDAYFLRIQVAKENDKYSDLSVANIFSIKSKFRLSYGDLFYEFLSNYFVTELYFTTFQFFVAFFLNIFSLKRTKKNPFSYRYRKISYEVKHSCTECSIYNTNGKIFMKNKKLLVKINVHQ